MYQDARLPWPDMDDYKNDFEKEFFMVVNLVRNNPQQIMRNVKNFAAQGNNGPHIHPQACRVVESKLRELDTLPPVSLDGQASNSCYVNLTKNENDDGDQIAGGAVTEYKKQITRSSASDFELGDNLKKGWRGSPLELLLNILFTFYSNPSNQEYTHSLISPQLKAIGCALISSKRHGQLFQVLYLKERKD